ncbi:hypothetical protein BC567DRAFT_232371 [Phyllosticta citribraziliensis]
MSMMHRWRQPLGILDILWAVVRLHLAWTGGHGVLIDSGTIFRISGKGGKTPIQITFAKRPQRQRPPRLVASVLPIVGRWDKV